MPGNFKAALTIGSVLLSVGCAPVNAVDIADTVRSAVAPEPQIGVTARNQIVPLIDAHQHMMGPAAMGILKREPSPPTVAVPAVLAELLSAREKGVDQANFAALFTPDAMVFAEEQGRWWTGQERLLDALGNFGTGVRFEPKRYALDGSAGYVAGTLRTASGTESDTFVLGLKKGADGRWRIASEMKQAILPPTYAPSIDAERIIEVLDDAGIKYATVLSLGYWFGDPEKNIEDRWAGTRVENDWTIAQARKYPDRLIPFCGVNPIDDYAIAELERCAGLGVPGMKIHRNSKFRTSNPEHVEKLKQFFRAANKNKMAIVIHVLDLPDILIDQILPEAPDIPIQIAHMGSGTLEMFAEAIEAGKPGTKNLWFDWTQALPVEDLWTHGNPGGGIGGPVAPGAREEMAALIRRVGVDRVLFGTDMPLAWNPTPRTWWRKTILTLPLTDDELRDIADNLPPYVR